MDQIYLLSVWLEKTFLRKKISSAYCLYNLLSYTILEYVLKCRYFFIQKHTVVQVVNNLPAVWETHIQSLDQEDSLEKELATYSSIFAWRITWTEKLAELQSMSQRVRYDWATNTHTCHEKKLNKNTINTILYTYKYR